MKQFRRGLSIFLTILMLISVIPLSAVSVSADDGYDDTDINIPISLDGVTQTRGQAMAKTLSYQKSGKQVWKHPAKFSKFLDMMSSEKDEDKYICLTKDLSDYWKHSSLERTVISSNKILDLNGHEIVFHIDSIVRPWSKAGIEQSPYQRDDQEHLMATAFEISKGATLTIIDSSMKDSVNGDKGKGGIKMTGYAVNVYKHDYNNYPNFEIFDVSDGNLVIYGGNFSAGRSKAQYESNFSWSKLKTVIGQAVELGMNIAAYATGIDAAVASKDDLLEGFKKLAGESDASSTKEKTEKTEQTTKGPDGEKQNQTVGEKQDGIDNPKPDADGNTPDKKKNNSENGENKANDNQSAKTDKNSKIAEANKKICDSVLNKDGITDMVNTAFSMAENIAGMIGDNQNSRVIQNIFGTCVRVGNKGAFVSYGGNYTGYGSSPNTRDAVVEVVRSTDSSSRNKNTGKYKGGLAYIYGGEFNARAGANVFNIVASNAGKTVSQTRSDDNGNRTTEQVKIAECETHGLEELKYESNGVTPIDTANISVRGGTFKNYYEVKNVGIKTKDDKHFSTFIGTSGSVNLGITSFNEDFIKDGRIQICDMYGEGALVLMDENRNSDNDLYHYRLFCSDMELRYKQGLRVYPNTAKANTTSSFALKTQLNGGDTVGLEKVFCDDNENARGAYSTTEKMFYFPINSESTNGYTIKPTFKNLDPDAENMASSDTWYYQDPVDTENDPIPKLSITDTVISGTLKSSALSNYTENDPKTPANDFNSALNSVTTTFGGQTYVDERTVDDTSEKNLNKIFDNYSAFDNTYNYQSNLKWFEYKVYKVDPLTRLNIGSDGKLGDNKPIAVGAYGDEAKKGLKTMIRLTDLENKIKAQNSSWEGYKQGEMYRITLSVEERLNYDYEGYDLYKNDTAVSDNDKYAYTTNVGTAKATSSIVFMCYGEDERTVKEGYNSQVEDFTPLQWAEEPQIGTNAKINFVNAKTGNVDFETTRIFDIYYQWWTVNDNGKKEKLIAGTNNIWNIANRYRGAKESKMNETDTRALLNRDKGLHTYSNWLRGKDGYKYANSLAPDDPLRNELDRNGKKLNLGEDNLPVIEYDEAGQVVKGTNKWPASVDAASRLIHAYSQQWFDEDDLKEHKDYNLSNKNNNLDYGNSDTCYIPKSLAGKKIMVEAVAVNVNWTDYYDAIQTFYSHTFQLPDREFDNPVSCSVDVKYDNNFVSIGKEATLSVGSMKGLDDDEYPELVEYIVLKNGRHYKYKNFYLDKGDELPTAKFPSDFFDAKYLEKGKNYAKLSASEYEMQMFVRTNLDSEKADRYAFTEKVPVKFEVEAERYEMIKDSYSFSLDEIKEGKIQSGTQDLINVYPVNASVGVYYDSAKTTDKSVAYIDENGKLAFGGKAGTAKLSIKGPDGNTVSTQVEVIDYVNDVEISDIDPPEIGKTFDNKVTIPDTADYKIKEVFWTDGSGDRLASDAVAKNYKVYTINMVVEKAEPSLVFKKAENTYLDYHPFTLYVTDVDGGVQTIINNPVNGKFDYVKNAATGDYEIGDTCTYSYTYRTAVGEADTEINRISLDFPTEVKEGDSVDEWMEQFIASTNGDDTEFIFTPSFVMTSYAEQTLNAYGYKLNLSDPTDSMKAFVRGAIDGPSMKIDLVWKDSVKFAPKDKVNILINGETNANATLDITSSTTATITVPNAVTVLEGKTIPALPAYRLKDFNLAVDETVKLNDLITSDGNVKYTVDLKKMNDIAEYVEFNEANNSLTGIKASGELTIPLYVTVDGDGDGVADMRVNCNISKKVYASASDCPAPDNGEEINVNVKALKPDGSTAYEGYYKAYKSSTGADSAVLSIPEVDDALITKIDRKRSGSFKYDVSGGADRISASLNDGDSITVYTADAADIRVKNSSTELYPSFDGVDKLCVSLDGDHWTQSKLALTGLTPDTEYLLYYKQGPAGAVNTKVVRTAPDGSDYGIYLGKNPITKADPGILERDGYHYDAATKTLTLKNFSLVDSGVDVSTFKVFNLFNFRSQSTVYAKDDLTIELIGDNFITTDDGESDFLVGNIIHTMGDLTIKGEGNLTLTGSGVTQAIETEKGKNVYLKGTGKLTFEDTTIGILANEGSKIYYSNGEIDYNGNRNFFDGTYILGQLCDSDSFVSTSAVHDIKIFAGKDDSVEVNSVNPTEKEGSADYNKVKENIDIHDGQSIVHIIPQHTFTEKVESERYYVSGDCTTDTTYYMSCSCGAADHEHTFTVEAKGHDLVHHEGKDATCTEDGYKAYDTCSKCGYTTFEVIPAKGHSYIHHDEVLPDCEHDGCPAYDECSVCGYSSLDKTIKLSLENNKDKVPSGADEEGSEVERDDIWAATGHDLIAVPEVACTCSENGTRAHFKCVHCHKLFEDEHGMMETSENNLVIEAAHDWGEWVVTKEPTETETGLEERTCARDPEHKQTRVIPVLGHTHHLTPVPFKDATETEDGNYPYYTCDGCDLWFEDAEGINVITDKSSVIIPKTGSTPTEPIPSDTTPTESSPTEPTSTEPAATDPITQPKLSKSSLSLKAGATKNLKVTDAKVKKWSTSNKKIATVTSKGVVTALKKGSVSITALLTNGKALICKVKVKNSPTIKINKKAFKAKTTYSVNKGKTLKVTIKGKAKSVKNVYSTSAKKVAKVVSKNTASTIKIKGLKKGKATVTVKVNGVAFKIKVKVK